MRMLFTAVFPPEPFNTEVRKGTVGQAIGGILEDAKPEMVYFTETDGRRSVMMLVDLPDPSRVAVLAEPWFLKFNADCRFRVVMSPEELKRAGLEELGKKWS